jgi:hypothetical protein
MHIRQVVFSCDDYLGSSPEPIRLATSRLIQGIYLTLRCLIKKLSIMNKFIEIPVNGENHLVNTSWIQCIIPLENGSKIILADSKIVTEMPYKELSDIIMSYLGL